MYISIKDYIESKGISGDVILYRDRWHKKRGLCQYLAQNISTNKTICVYSGGAFGLYMAKAFANNKVVVCGNVIADEYKQQILQLPNAIVIEGKTNLASKQYADQMGYLFVDQFDNPLIKQYYKNHFLNLIAEVQAKHVNAFCDCGHSCATLAGAIASGVDVCFVLGINRIEGTRQRLYYLTDYKDRFVQQTTRDFDTTVLQKEIEALYSSFGNVFEATRSISASMSWLKQNPGKTVLVYVGDSPVFGEDITI